MLFEKVLAEPAFRANLPRPNTGGLDDHLADLAEKIGDVLKDPKTAATIASFQKDFFYPRHGYDLPALLETPIDVAYKVRGKDIKLIEQGGRHGLVKAGSRNAVEVPGDVTAMVDWVLKRQQFSRSELANAFPDRSAQALDKLLTDLGTMRLTEIL